MWELELDTDLLNEQFIGNLMQRTTIKVSQQITIYLDVTYGHKYPILVDLYIFGDCQITIAITISKSNEKKKLI